MPSSSSPILIENEVEVKSGAHTKGVYSISFSASLNLAVTTSHDHTAVVWRGKGEKGWTKTATVLHPSCVFSCMFHPTSSGGKLFATGCEDGGVRLCRVRGRGRDEVEGEMEVDGVDICDEVINEGCGQVRSLSFSPSGTRLAVGCYADDTLYIYAVQSGERERRGGGEEEGWPACRRIAKLHGAHRTGVNNRVAFSALTFAPPSSPLSTSMMMASVNGGSSSDVTVWTSERQEGEQEEERWNDAHTLSTTALHVKTLAFASSYPAYYLPSPPRVLDRKGGKGREGEGEEGNVGTYLPNVGTDWLAAGCDGGSVMVWQCSTSTSPPSFSTAQVLSGVHSGNISGVTFAVSSDGGSTLLVTGDISGTLCVWRGARPPHSLPSPPALSSPLSPPSFVQMQKVKLNGVLIFDCAFSPSGCAFGIADLNNSQGGYGPHFWQCRGVGKCLAVMQ